MRKVGVVTVGRSDFGIYLPVLEAIDAASELKLCLIASGAHLSPRFGRTLDDIRAHGFRPAACVDMLVDSDRPADIAKSMGLGVTGFTEALCRESPDVLLVLGDRFEMHSAASAAVPLRIPLAHLHGGEVTEGAIDESFRHSITKMSHLHFVSAEPYRRRVIQMGEEPWRVVVSGAPALDRVKRVPLLGREQFEREFGVVVDDPTLLVTFHPVTHEPGDTEMQLSNLLSALDRVSARVVFTYPNADSGNRGIIEMLRGYVGARQDADLLANLGPRGYFSLMRLASAMVGNSSSGIIEAPSFGLPVVNVGSRQKGRLRAANVLDVGYAADEIHRAVMEALSPDARRRAAEVVNPHGGGNAAEKIVQTLLDTRIDERLLTKRFHDLPLDARVLEEESSSLSAEAVA